MSTQATSDQKLKDRWMKLISSYCTDEARCQEIFDAVLAPEYKSSKRAYHNFNHVSDLLDAIDKYAEETTLNLDVLQFSAWFHDLIYNPFRKDNEERSARAAEKELQQLELSPALVEHITHIIRRTGNHMEENPEDSAETAFFLDADLMILGADQERYTSYTKEIRSEYKMVPKLAYNMGRSKVIQRFLYANCIYQTDVFRLLFEEKARENLTKELTELHGN